MLILGLFAPAHPARVLRADSIMRKRTCFWILALLWAASASSAAPVSLTPETLEGTLLNAHVESFFVEREVFSPEDVFAGRLDKGFHRAQDDHLHQSGPGVTWIRLRTTSADAFVWYLENDRPYYKSLTLYERDDSGVYRATELNSRVSGRLLSPNSAVFRMNERPGENVRYLRLYHDSLVMLALRAWSLAELGAKVNLTTAIFGLFYGVLLIMTLYHFFVFLAVRDRTYLWFAIAMPGYAAGMGAYDGMLNYVPVFGFWIDDRLYSIFAYFGLGTMLLFPRYYIDTPRHAPRFDRFLLGTAVVSAVMWAGVFTPLYDSTLWIQIYLGLLFLVFVSLMIMPAQLALRGVRIARYYVGANFAMMAGGLFLWLVFNGVIAPGEINRFAPHIGILVMITLFSLGLADRINRMRTELLDLNVNLERKVAGRTEELRESNQYLIHTNRNLETMQAEAERDMRLAYQVQSSVLPSSAPAVRDWEIAYAFQPVAFVSGDFYDFYVDKDRLEGVILVDVSGHGIASGLITMVARSIFKRFFRDQWARPLGRLVQEANQVLTQEMQNTDRYMTGIFLRLKGDTVEYVNAAHPELLVKKGDQVRTVRAADDQIPRGCLLGVDWMDNTFEAIKISMPPGSALLLYSDCLIETYENETNKEYGKDRLAAALAAAPEGTAEEILDFIMRDFMEFSAGSKMTDDLTAIVLKRTGSEV